MAESQPVAREKFLRDRRKGIGGSDVAALFNLDRYRTIEDLWLDKTGQVIPIDEPNGDKERGIELEPLVLKMFERDHGRRIIKPVTAFVHPDFPWMRANIDGQDANELDAIIETKCPSIGAYSKMKREGLDFAKVLQMQHYLCVTGARRGTWVIFCADRWEMLVFDMERDEEIIRMIIEKEKEFWILVETMTPPPPVVREIKDEPSEAQVGSVTIRRDDEFAEAVAVWREAQALKKTGESLEADAKEAFKSLVGKRGIFESAGARIYYTEQAGKKSFDQKALAAAKPLDRLATIVAFAKVLDSLDVDESDAATVMQTALADADLDISAFQKVGKPFETLRPYFFGD